MNSDNNGAAFISRTELKATKLIGMADSTLDLWIRQVRFPRSYHPSGCKQAYFLVKDVDTWLAAQAGEQPSVV
jgi:predicted DNA-binding transcriptional regulator AlpA